jgi:hypothetical protein
LSIINEVFMKFKMLVATCLSLLTPIVFAVTPAPAITCNMFANATGSAAANMVNTCVPEVKLYVAGTGALKSAIPSLFAGLFDNSFQIITINDISGTSRFYWPSFYGMSKPALTGGVSKRLHVIYQNTNEGVSLLLSKTGSIPDGSVITVGPTNVRTANTCVEAGFTVIQIAGGVPNISPAVNCTSVAATSVDVAISPVHPTELYKLDGAATGKLSSLISTSLAIEGFGVSVSGDLYNALQIANIREGLLPSTCVAGDQTAACQPSIRRADYTSLITKSGSIKSAADLLGDPSDTNILTLARYSDLNENQAASNIFFAGNPCKGMGYDNSLGFNYNPTIGKIDKTVAAVMGGGLNIISATYLYPRLFIQSNAYPVDVKATLDSGAVPPALVQYSIGVDSLVSRSGALNTWRFVKLDGVSPNFNPDGTPDIMQRTALAEGNYPFAMTAFAITPSKPVANSAGKLYPQLISSFISGLRDSTLHDIPGVAYIDGVADYTGYIKHAKYHRTANNNCSPLIR